MCEPVRLTVAVRRDGETGRRREPGDTAVCLDLRDDGDVDRVAVGVDVGQHVVRVRGEPEQPVEGVEGRRARVGGGHHAASVPTAVTSGGAAASPLGQ